MSLDLPNQSIQRVMVVNVSLRKTKPDCVKSRAHSPPGSKKVHNIGMLVLGYLAIHLLQ